MKKLSFFLLVLLLLLVGCSEQLVNPTESIAQTENWQKALVKQNLSLIKLPTSTNTSLNKSITERAYADKNNTIDFHYDYETIGNTKVKIKMQLKIFKNALDEDTDITIEIDDVLFLTNLTTKFSPGGTNFKIPAEFDLVGVGLELGDDDFSNLKFAYFNESSGLWEEMPVKKLKVNNNGKLVCKDGKIPHFSRFGFLR